MLALAMTVQGAEKTSEMGLGKLHCSHELSFTLTHPVWDSLQLLKKKWHELWNKHQGCEQLILACVVSQYKVHSISPCLVKKLYKQRKCALKCHILYDGDRSLMRP